MYKRIEDRVDWMMESGLLAEARSLYEHRELGALQTVGYQEVFEHLSGKWNLQKAIEEIKKNTRRYAKRQMTWLRKNTDIQWIDFDQDKDDVIELINGLLKS